MRPLDQVSIFENFEALGERPIGDMKFIRGHVTAAKKLQEVSMRRVEERFERQVYLRCFAIRLISHKAQFDRLHGDR